MTNERAHSNHSHYTTNKLSGKKLIFTIILNFLITIIQIIGGTLSNSLALISDALHNLSDGFAILISFLADKISRKEKDLRRTFGYKRAEILAALLNAVFLIIISFFLFKEAIYRFQSPEKIDSSIMFAVAVFGLAANLLGVILLKADSKNSLNIRSAYIHLISDTISSVAVIIGALIIKFFHFYYIDSIFTILIGLYVLREGFLLLKETMSILMQSAPKNIDLLEIKKEIDSLEGVDNVHHVHIWQTNDKDIFFEGHIDLCQDYKISEVDQIRKKIENLLTKKFQINHITIQPEFGICENKGIIASSKN